MKKINIEEILKEFEELTKKVFWRFAITYANSCPHEYIVNENIHRFKADRKTIEKLYELLNILLWEKGKIEQFGKKTWRVFIHNGFKYWFDYNVLNRKPLKGYEIMRKDGYLFVKRKGEKEWTWKLKERRE